jgi:hypothetical protein
VDPLEIQSRRVKKAIHFKQEHFDQVNDFMDANREVSRVCKPAQHIAA